MTLLATAQLWSHGSPAGATSTLARSTSRISQLGGPATRPLLPSFRLTPPRSSTWPGWAQLPIEDLGEYFLHSPDPVS
jgi:hypothetical protein